MGKQNTCKHCKQKHINETTIFLVVQMFVYLNFEKPVLFINMAIWQMLQNTYIARVCVWVCVFKNTILVVAGQV